MYRFLRLGSRAAWTLATMALALGCSSPSQPDASANTNWLKECSNDSQCGAYACQCNYCTPRCDGTLDCGRAPAEICIGSTDAAGGNHDDNASAVAACEASVDAVRADCVAEDPSNARLCIYDAIRPLCKTGRTPFVKAVFDCLKADACQTPSDPSSAGACVLAAVHEAATSDDRAFGTLACGCNSQPNCTFADSMPNVMLLKESDISPLTNCYAAGCEQGDPCISATRLAPVFACK